MIRDRLSRSLAVLALVASISTVSACSAGSTAVVDTSSQTGLVVATTSPANSLDLTSVGGAAIPAAVMGNVYETLVRIDDDGDIVPGLAESWEVSSDGTRYEFQLHEGVSFSNGAPFNAESAAFSINYVKDTWTNGLAAQMDIVKRAEAQGEHTLVVELERRSNGWLWLMGTAIGAMMTPTGMDNLASEPVGTGPFEVARFSPNEFVALAVRPDYWGEPAEQDVTIRYFPDPLSAVNALETGGADVVWAMQNPELLDGLDEDINITVGTTNGEILFSLNNDEAPFNDPRVRQAVAYGVDRDAANAILWEGMATDTGGAPVPPTDPWFPEQDYYPHDMAKAQQLLREAGAEAAPVTITAPTLPYTQTLSEQLYSQLTEIGFDVTLESAEFPAVWLGQVMGAHDYQASLVAHVEPRDIPTLFGDPDYYLGYDNERARELLAQADSAIPEDYPELMGEAVDQIMDDAAAVTLMNMPNVVLTRPGISGISADMVTDAIELRDLKEER